MSSLESCLTDTFGYTAFRPQQREIIETILDGDDILCLMPTGAGKSICYQLPALIPMYRDSAPGHLTVVISPLLSLIYDQILDLRHHNILAHNFDGTTTLPISSIFADITAGKCSILYTTPESIYKNISLRQEVDALYQKGKLDRFIIDEAHCVSSWGHDFRPSYLQLDMKTWFPGTPICAFTATATKLVRQDIIKNLALSQPRITSTSFIKSNISYKTKPKEADTWSYLGNSVAKAIKEGGYTRSSGIIYCLSRKECEYHAKVLKSKGIKAEFFHARIPVDKKKKVQTDWLDGKISVIVATIAFALGINKPDVRYIIHTSMPKSIESYYQQAGRAGRDGKPSKCIMYYSKRDRTALISMTQPRSRKGQTSPDPKPPISSKDRIEDIYRMCRNSTDCIKLQMSNYLGEYGVRETCMTSTDPSQPSGPGQIPEQLCSSCQRQKYLGRDETTITETKVRNILSMVPCDFQEFRQTQSDDSVRIAYLLLNNGALETDIIACTEILSASLSHGSHLPS